MRGYWDDFVDCWSSPWQCVKAATGAVSSAPVTTTTAADIAYRRMKMPKAPEEVIVPAVLEVPEDSGGGAPGTSCPPGYIIDTFTGQCAKLVSPAPQPGPQPDRKKESYTVPTIMLIASVLLVGGGLILALRGRKD